MGKKILPLMLAGCIFLGGCALLAYPRVSQWLNGMHQSEVIADYSSTVDGLDEEAAEKELQRAADYNRELTDTGSLTDPFENKLEANGQYPTLLNFTAEGVMGYIEIPKIKCNLPIYHGTDEAVLQIAIGHVQGSSLPAGGESTHCVLSGHRGLPSAKLFSDLDQLTEGDVFLLRVLDETLTYEVDQIRTVLPDELDDLAIEEGKEYCTLVTCTPYGINSHRLLVRGHRVENQASASTIRVTADAMQIEPLLIAPLVAVPMLLVLLVMVLIPHRTKKKG